jgi:hypothetical protein
MMLFQYRLSTPSNRKQEVLAVAGSPLAYDEGGLSLRAYKEPQQTFAPLAAKDARTFFPAKSRRKT